MLPDVARSAAMLATLGAIDSLLTSLVADSLTQSFHDSDRELLGQVHTLSLHAPGQCFDGNFTQMLPVRWCSCCQRLTSSDRLRSTPLDHKAGGACVDAVWLIELVLQGIGNAVAGLCGGCAGAGATMRTVVNIRAGGRTPISGMMHSIALTTIVLGAATPPSLLYIVDALYALLQCPSVRYNG